jgi:RNA polymerase sigma-70 factor (ECF subfamily)
MNRNGRAGINEANAARGRQPIGPATDPSLVDRARLGDVEAFALIVHARTDAVYRLSLGIVGDGADASDVTQETFITAWRRLRALRDADRFDAWLYRIALNAARMAVRRRTRRRLREITLGAEAASVATGTPSRASDAGRLELALRHLSVDQREILALHHIDGRPVADIAGILEIPVGTVKSRLFTARRALDAALTEVASE